MPGCTLASSLDSDVIYIHHVQYVATGCARDVCVRCGCLEKISLSSKCIVTERGVGGLLVVVTSYGRPGSVRDYDSISWR